MEHCTNLRELTLCHVCTSSPHGFYDGVSDWITHTLQNTRSDALKKVTLTLTRPELPDSSLDFEYDTIDFAAIGRALREPKFAGLTHVDLNIPSDVSDAELQGLRKQLDESVKLPPSMQFTIGVCNEG